MNENKVFVVPGEEQKYVLVSVSKEESKEILLVGDPKAEWHKNIIEELNIKGFKIIDIFGGGRILISEADKKIYVWGKSFNYGEAPEDLVRDVIQNSLPDYKIIRTSPTT